MNAIEPVGIPLSDATLAEPEGASQAILVEDEQSEASATSPSVRVEDTRAEQLSASVEREKAPAPEAGWRLRLGIEPLAWGAVGLVAALARLPSLDAVPLRFSDSARALAAWQVAAGHYPTAWSGDLAQVLTAAIFKLFGSGDGTARLASALLGIGLVAAFVLLRPVAGRGIALLAGFFIAVSPACVAVSRSLSAYSAGALFAVAVAGLLFTFLARPRRHPLLALAFVLGLGLSSDASFLAFLLIAMLFCGIEALWRRDEAFLPAVDYLREHRQILRSLLSIWAAGALLALSRFGIAPDRLRSGAFLSWSDAFNAPAGALPWHFPLLALAGYEPLLLIAGGVETIVLWRRQARASVELFERFLPYWIVGELLFTLVTPGRGMGQLPSLLVPLALAASIAFSRWLASGEWIALRGAMTPALLAFPAFVYVLFVLQSSAFRAYTAGQGLDLSEEIVLLMFLIGGAALLVCAAIWAGRSAPAFLAGCGLVFGLVFALHSLTRLSFRAGDEYLLGPVATTNAPALGEEVVRIAPSLKGRVSLSPSLAEPLAWYMRGARSVRIEPTNRASAGVVQPVDQTVLPSFQILIGSNEIGRAWYPSAFDLQGIVRWLLYRQAWSPVDRTQAQFIVK